ncbi:MAG: pseudouridine synthase [Acidimicrobiia bacterium]
MPDAPSARKVRLQKILAGAGIASRRKCEELIAAGRVAVNGRVARLGDKADPEKDEITVDGEPVPLSQKRVYILLNKPAGTITSVKDEHATKTVLDLLPHDLTNRYRLFPVGRLDKDSEGLLILTNDGELAHRLTHPSSKLHKTYVVAVSGSLVPGAFGKLRRGIELEDGRTLPAKVRQLDKVGGRRILRITITEGRKRQIRRMIAAVGGRVEALVRTAIGPLRDRKLSSGQWRYLTPAEVHQLYMATRLHKKHLNGGASGGEEN